MEKILEKSCHFSLTLYKHKKSLQQAIKKEVRMRKGIKVMDNNQQFLAISKVKVIF